MWNPFQKNKRRIEELEKRLTHNSEIIAEDHDAIACLMRENVNLKAVIEGLVTGSELLIQRTEQLEKKHSRVQEAFAGAFVGEHTLVTDHICGSMENPVEFCQYCCDQKRYDGAECSCSPQGYPHSGECKGWFPTSPAYEDIR